MCNGIESEAIRMDNGVGTMFAPFKERLVLYPRLDDRCQERVR
jgi:hypothetical protein